ncbi:hypothetical protein ACFC18_47185 [Streptomyces sp. NPDC056121]
MGVRGRRAGRPFEPGAKEALQEIYNVEDRDHAMKDLERANGGK